MLSDAARTLRWWRDHMGENMEETIVRIARIAHEMNRRWCQLTGDDSQQAWDVAPQWQRDSAVEGVKFHLANPDAGPNASHDSWLETKRAEGWKFGPVKDATKKEHPCFVPYAALPHEQKAKDTFFLTVVHALA